MTKSDVDDQQKHARKYQKINKEERKVVLKLLIHDKLSLQEVANRLKLKYCTVRTIQKAYEKDGRIGKKETRKKKLKVENILKISIVNPFTFQLSEPIVLIDLNKIIYLLFIISLTFRIFSYANNILIIIQIFYQIKLNINPNNIIRSQPNKQPTKADQVGLAKEQRSLLQSQCQKLYIILSQQLQKAMENSNPLYQSTLQNLLWASQLVIKQLLEVKQQINVKQEHEPVSPNQTQYPFPIQHNIYQSQYGFVLPRINS